MRAAKCSFCQHTNPQDAKFCNACGAPLYLVPCPHCGAVNDATASVCHQCAAKLQGDGPAPPPSGARRSASAGVAAPAGSTPDPVSLQPQLGEEPDRDAQVFATLQQIRQLLERSEADAAPGTADPVKPASAVPQQATVAIADRSDVPRVYPVSTVAEFRQQRVEPRVAHGDRRAVIVGAILLGAVAAAAYSVYRWVADVPLAPVADKASDRGSPVATGTVVAPKGSPGVEALARPTPAAAVPPAVAVPTPSGAVPPAVAVPTPSGEVPAVRPGTAGASDARGQGAASVVRSPEAEQRSARADGKDPSPKSAAAVPGAVARPRTAEATAGFELQQPRVGPCTEVVAALGLCTREPAQGRE